jgi:hypothetical protein
MIVIVMIEIYQYISNIIDNNNKLFNIGILCYQWWSWYHYHTIITNLTALNLGLGVGLGLGLVCPQKEDKCDSSKKPNLSLVNHHYHH